MAVRPQTHRARQLRRNMTDAERTLWRALREMNIPHKVRRQHPTGDYVTDFAVPACRLVIEIDGGQHADAVQEDGRRTKALNDRGYRVIRFWNNEVLENTEGVLQTIVTEIEKTTTSP